MQSARTRKLIGVTNASPREKWKVIAHSWSEMHPTAASTVTLGRRRVRDGSSTPIPPARSIHAVVRASQGY